MGTKLVAKIRPPHPRIGTEHASALVSCCRGLPRPSLVIRDSSPKGIYSRKVEKPQESRVTNAGGHQNCRSQHTRRSVPEAPRLLKGSGLVRLHPCTRGAQGFRCPSSLTFNSVRECNVRDDAINSGHSRRRENQLRSRKSFGSPFALAIIQYLEERFL